MKSKILSITLSILVLGSLCLTGCSSINNSKKDKANDITQLTTFSIDYSDGVDESTNFYFSVNLSNMDENIYDMYYTGSNGDYEGTLKDTDLVELIDILNEVEYLKIGENLPTEPVDGDTSYISTMIVYTDGVNTNNSIDRVVYSITNSEREKISEVYTVINQSTLLKDGITESVNDDINTDEDLNNTDEDKNIDKVASSYVDSIITKAKESGFGVTAEDICNGLEYDMGTYYTGIPEDSDAWNSISSVTVHTSLLSVTAYQLVFIGVNDIDKLSEVEQVVKDNLDWTRWVCVMPTNGCVTTYEIPEVGQLVESGNPEDYEGTVGYVILLMGVDDPEYSVNTFDSVYNALCEFTGKEIDILDPVGEIYEVGSEQNSETIDANAGGSGEAEVYETGEEDVVVGKDPSLVENTENSEAPVYDMNKDDGGSWGFDSYEKGADLPSEEKAEWFDNLIDENNTVLQ